MEEKEFRIMGKIDEGEGACFTDITVPWGLVAQHEDYALGVNRQSLETINSRGGYSARELLIALSSDPKRGKLIHPSDYKMNDQESLDLVMRMKNIYLIAKQNGFEGNPDFDNSFRYQIAPRTLSNRISSTWSPQMLEAAMSETKNGSVAPDVFNLARALHPYVPQRLQLQDGQEIIDPEEVRKWLESLVLSDAERKPKRSLRKIFSFQHAPAVLEETRAKTFKFRIGYALLDPKISQTWSPEMLDAAFVATARAYGKPTILDLCRTLKPHVPETFQTVDWRENEARAEQWLKSLILVQPRMRAQPDRPADLSPQ